MMPSSATVLEATLGSTSRFELWASFLNTIDARRVAEVGVYRGDFAAQMLKACAGLQTYFLIDPWRHLEDWNKPANKSDAVFEGLLAETLAKTDFASSKRMVLRGTTVEVIDAIEDESLDFAYIDGDHTLKGITIDLVRMYPKIRPGGYIGGDDFTPNIWQHDETFEPTMVFPLAVYFAQAMNARIHALPHSQFLIEKGRNDGFTFVDHVKAYSDLGLRNQFVTRTVKGKKSGRLQSVAAKLYRRLTGNNA